MSENFNSNNNPIRIRCVDEINLHFTNDYQLNNNEIGIDDLNSRKKRKSSLPSPAIEKRVCKEKMDINNKISVLADASNSITCNLNSNNDNHASSSNNVEDEHDYNRKPPINVNVSSVQSSTLADSCVQSVIVTNLDVKKEVVNPSSSTDHNVPSSSTVIPISSSSIVKEEATSTSSNETRESCKYGIRCYRRNVAHKLEMAHPGDDDYKRPNYPSPPIGTPVCPYGDRCYRRNPIHFQQFSHSLATNFKEKQESLDDEIDEFDEFEDPFSTDGSSDEDYIPSDND